MALPHIHIFYRVWFQWVDPLVLIPTIYALLFTPQVMLDAFIPPPLSAYNPDQGFLLHQLAAMYAFVAIVLGVGLRATNEIKIWKVIIGGILAVDIAILASVCVSLEQQGRLGDLRSADWGNIVFTGLVSVIRALFLAGVGVGKENVRSKQL